MKTNCDSYLFFFFRKSILERKGGFQEKSIEKFRKSLYPLTSFNYFFEDYLNIKVIASFIINLSIIYI